MLLILAKPTRWEMARDGPVANLVDRASTPPPAAKGRQEEAARISVLTGYWEMHKQGLSRL